MYFEMNSGLQQLSLDFHCEGVSSIPLMIHSVLEQWRLNRERYAKSSMVLMLSVRKVRIGLGGLG